MFSIKHPTAAAAKPAKDFDPGDQEGWFTPGDPDTDTPATLIKFWWLNTIQAELLAVLTAAGIAADDADDEQLAAAIQTLINDSLPTVSENRVFVEAATFEGTVSDGDVVYWDNGNNRFAKALADGSATGNALGLADVTSSEVTIYGEHTAGIAGLTPGARYYLSGDTAGELTDTAPADTVKMGVAKSAGAIFVDPDRGESVTDASQAEMEAASATNVYTSPGRQHLHHGHAKAVVRLTNLTGTPTITVLSNHLGTLSASREAAGKHTLSWATAITNLIVVALPEDGVSQNAALSITARSSTSVSFSVVNSAGTQKDVDSLDVIVFGDMP